MTLSDWIDSQPFQYNKVNVRQWGSFELQVTIDGRSAHLTQIRGWGWSEKDAFQDILTEMMRDVRFHHNLSSWLGQERFVAVLSAITANPAEEPDGIGDRKKIPSKIERVEEGNESISNIVHSTGVFEQRASSEIGGTPYGEINDTKSGVFNHQGENLESTNSTGI